MSIATFLQQQTSRVLVLLVAISLAPYIQASGQSQVDGSDGTSLMIQMRGAENYMYEPCVFFKPGDVVSFRFHSKHPVDFNVHYHDKNKTLFPIKVSTCIQN